VVTWSDRRSGSNECRSDARAEEGSTPSVVADWNDPPAASDVPFGPPGDAAAVSIIPNPLNRPPNPEVTVLAYQGATAATTELWMVHGRLDAAASPNLVLTCSASALTGLAPPRPSGFVVLPSAAADEDLSDVYVVWADTKDGAPRIYFKRSDSVTASPDPAVASPGDCPSGGGIELTWTPPPSPPHCDIDHYRVEYGTAPGVYDRSLDVAPASRTAITGLGPGTRYYLRVTTVDQACNERPSIEVSALAPDCTGVVLCPNPVGNSLKAARAGRDVALSWDVPGSDPAHHAATSYDVYRSQSRPQDGYLRIAAPVPTSARDFNAVPFLGSRQHFYRIVARNACGSSGDVPPP
jgi:hypothetical protein